MNVEIGAEAALFPEKEYINAIAVAVWLCGTSESASKPCPPPFGSSCSSSTVPLPILAGETHKKLFFNCPVFLAFVGYLRYKISR
jgi:hypothetical protein